MEYSGTGGKLIHEINQKHKISWHCPFKYLDGLEAGRGDEDDIGCVLWASKDLERLRVEFPWNYIFRNISL